MQKSLDLGLVDDAVVFVIAVIILLDLDAKVDDRVVLEQNTVLSVGRIELRGADRVVVGEICDLEVEVVIMSH